VKNINLRVRKDATVMVSAGEHVPDEMIKKFVRSKASWILKHLRHVEERKSVKELDNLGNDHTVYYLGMPYKLEVIETAGRQTALFQENQIILLVKDRHNVVTKRNTFTAWLKEKGKTEFKHSLERIHPLVAAYDINKPKIVIRAMKSRWGSCSFTKNKITLNTELLKYPVKCIDYVVLHELAHFRYKKHDQAFYQFLTKIMPDWKERKKILKEIAAY
jgi:predicted metal-dependent hydrolase